ASFWNFFDQILEHILGNDTEEYHFLGTVFKGILQSESYPIQVNAVRLSIAIEQIVMKYFKNSGMPDDQFLSELDVMINIINQANVNAILNKRLIGSAGQMKASRAVDILIKLSEQGEVTADYIAAWKKLRNAYVHGNWDSVKNPQDLIDLIARVRTLAHEI